MVQFGAPNPSFVTGAIGGYFSVLGGIIEGSFAVKFYWGEECTELSDESLPLIAEINPVADFDENNFKKRINVSELQPIFVQPSATFNYEIDKTFLIIIPVADPDNPGYTTENTDTITYYQKTLLLTFQALKLLKMACLTLNH